MQLAPYQVVLLIVGGDMKIFIWNVGKSSILTTIDCHPEVILSVSWNYNGSRIVTSCKDKIFRVINPRTGQVIKVSEERPSSSPYVFHPLVGYRSSRCKTGSSDLLT